MRQYSVVDIIIKSRGDVPSIFLPLDSNPLTCYDVNKAILKFRFKFKYIFLFKNFSKIVNNSNFRSFLMISSLRLPRYM